MSAYELLSLRRDGPIATLTLERPERLNALSVGLMREIIAAAAELEADTAVRVVIVTGRGRYFSAGADLGDPELATGGTDAVERWQHRRTGPDMIRALFELRPLTIAAIRGGALGGGACIATACDFRIGTDDCVVGYPEIDLGMNLSWGSLPLCVRLVGPARAKRMVILGQKEPAEALERWGLLDEVCQDAELEKRALAMAHAYASKPPFAAQAIKRSVNALSSGTDAAIMHMDTDQFLLAIDSEEHRSAVQAFLEKRRDSR